MCKGPVAGDSLPALDPDNIGVKGLGGWRSWKADTEAGMPTLPVGYFSLGMDINSKSVFLLQLKSGFSPWPTVLSIAEPSESQTHPPPDLC